MTMTHNLNALRTIAAGLAICFGGIAQGSAQIRLQGKISTIGVINMPSQSGLHQYTHIWAFSPPNSGNDNSWFTNNVISGNASIDGVSLLEAWSSIETTQPTTTPCVTSDTCQRDPGLMEMYHSYNWFTYDSTASTSPVWQWLQLSEKKVNLLITGTNPGMLNASTPYYVTSPWWYNQFNPQEQDVINSYNNACGLNQWTGTTSTSISYSGGTMTVTSTNCCSASDQSATIQDQDMVWVTATPSACGTNATGAHASVSGGSTNTFSYTPNASGTCSAPSSVTFISPSESWPVPYEYPYMNALKAFWAAVVAHYGPNFKLPAGIGPNYYPQLYYFRFGGSAGSEWYPYCTSSLSSLPNGYGYTKSAWLNYYQQMGNYLQSLGPPWKIIHSINAAESSPVDYGYATQEAAYAVGWSNAFGVRDGFGSQGLSASDYVNCVTNSCTPACTTGGAHCAASNWYPLFGQYSALGVPLELQPESLSYPGDLDCSNPTCGTGNGKYSGDLPTFLNPFATAQGTTDVEIYWRDLSLAYDGSSYCALNSQINPASCLVGSSISTGGQIVSPGSQFNFFWGSHTPPPQGVGQGTTAPYCNGTPPQSGAIGNCQYSNNIDAAHGQH